MGGPITTWCVKDVTDFSYAFENIGNFDDGYEIEPSAFNGDITSWDTSSGTSFESMFHKAAAFNQPIAEWDTGNNTRASNSFQNMFYKASLMLADPHSCPVHGPLSGCSQVD